MAKLDMRLRPSGGCWHYIRRELRPLSDEELGRRMREHSEPNIYRMELKEREIERRKAAPKEGE